MTATLRPSLAERVVNKVAGKVTGLRTSRRSFIGGAAVVGAALAVDPFGYLTRPASAYDAVCGADNTCAAGYTVFCCTINGGQNTCPPDSFIGGWWKADNSSFCGGNARYYIDCNAYRDGRYTCHCNTTTCDQRKVACNQFRYGQCNTQIPWSNTGPVLCRVVSCTPPWVQYGGTCSSSSATDNNTATHSAPCLNGNVPVGSVDRFTESGGVVRIQGWTYDADSPSTSLVVAIFQDGKLLMNVKTSVLRSDVNSSRHISGSHGFDVSFRPTPGRRTYAVYAYNIGAGSGNPLLGSYTVLVPDVHAPKGHVDVLAQSGPDVVVRGWAYDPDYPDTPTVVQVYQDGAALPPFRCAVVRSDVNSAYHLTGAHGFSTVFKPAPGTHNYRVWALNAGPLGGNTLIANKTMVVRSVAAAVSGSSFEASTLAASMLAGSSRVVGELESAVVTGNSTDGFAARLTGWAVDPLHPGAPVSIGVHGADGSLHWYQTDAERFEITLPAGRGLHTYTVFVLEETDEVVELGHETVRVDQAGAIGRISHADAHGDRVRLTGWAYDPDSPTTELALTVFRDGAPLADRFATGLEAPAGLSAAARLGRPGFELLIENPSGTHTYSVYAPTLRVGGRPVLIGTITAHDEDELRADAERGGGVFNAVGQAML